MPTSTTATRGGSPPAAPSHPNAAATLLPNQVLDDPHLSPTELRVYATLCRLATPTTAHARLSDLATHSGLSLSTCTRCVNTLRDRGLIRVSTAPARRRRFCLPHLARLFGEGGLT